MLKRESFNWQGMHCVYLPELESDRYLTLGRDLPSASAVVLVNWFPLQLSGGKCTM